MDKQERGETSPQLYITYIYIYKFLKKCITQEGGGCCIVEEFFFVNIYIHILKIFVTFLVHVCFSPYIAIAIKPSKIDQKNI